MNVGLAFIIGITPLLIACIITLAGYELVRHFLGGGGNIELD